MRSGAFIIILVGLVLLAACSHEPDYNEPGEPCLTVEGWIEDGGFPVVILTRSLPVSSDFQYIDSLAGHIVRWARVTVSDGTDSVVLTGKYDDRYFPPYIYTTGRLRGKAGKTYTLTVEYRDLRATATTTIPRRPMGCDFRVERCDNADSLYQIRARLADFPDEKNYYQFFVRVGTRTRQYLACYLGSIDDEVLLPETELPVYRCHQLGEKAYTPYFFIDDTVSVKLAQIDQASYRYWDSYTKGLSLSANMFLSTGADIVSNITGGYGYWCGYGAITDHIVIRDSVTTRRN